MDSFFLPLLSPFLPPVSLPCCHTVSPLSFSTCKSTYIISQLCCKPSSSSLINRLPHLYSSFFSLVGCTTVNLTLTHFLTARRAQSTHEKNVQDSLRDRAEIQDVCEPSFVNFSINVRKASRL